MHRKLLPVLIASCFAVGPVYANPTGPTVVSGQASIVNNGNTLTVTNTPGAIINWSSFSINPGELTQFLQQSSSSSVLNRITGQNPSQILGALQSNGKVFLINPNGIMFGANSRVNVAGLTASTLDIANSDFEAGKLNFAAGSTAGSVVNQGNIVTPSGGQVYLIAQQVQNSGIISSPQGEVLLAAGHSVQLVDGGDPNIQVVVSAPTDQALNLGSVVAQGGKIGIYGALINQSGVVNADSAVVGANGQIVLKSSQTTVLAGSSQTSADGAGNGGNIFLLGPQVELTDYSQVSANGQTGGGTILVGGGFHGQDAAVQNASFTYVGSGAAISANAVENGNGGKVAVWSNDQTQMYGAVSAKGGAQGGNGGFAEISGKDLLVMQGSSTTAAPKGQSGTTLLDPTDITITSSSSTGTDITLPNPTMPPLLVQSDGSAGVSTLSVNDLQTLLAAGNVQVTTASNASNSVNNGSLTVASPVSWSNNNTLTLNAYSTLAINANISGTGSSSTLELVAGTGISQASGTAIKVHDLSASSTSGAITLTGASNNIGGNFAASAPAGAVSLSNTGSTYVGSVTGQVGTVSGITSGGTTTLTSGGTITVAAPIQVNTAGNIALTAQSGIAINSTMAVPGSGTVSMQTANGDIIQAPTYVAS